MNCLLSFLAGICKKYPLEEKILIVPSYELGYELGKALACFGQEWINLRPETTTGLAYRIAGDYLSQKEFKLLPGYLTTLVVEEVFQALNSRGELDYYKYSYPGMARVLANIIFEMKMAGLTHKDLSRDIFIAKSKGRDLQVIFREYEEYLSLYKYIDFPGLLNNALKLALSLENNGPLYLVPSFMHFYFLEKKLIKVLAGKRIIILPLEPILGLKLPEGYWRLPGENAPRTKVISDLERLPWLFRLAQAPPPCRDGSLKLFHAYGLSAEVKEVIRQIMAGGIPLDKVAVVYPKDEYILAFINLARRIGFKVTVFEGIPAYFTRPGRVLSKIIDWIKSDFSAKLLSELFIEEKVKISTDISPAMAAKIIRLSGIGWGRERYRLLLHLKAKFLTEEEERDKREFVNPSGKLFTFIQNMLSLIPEPDEAGQVSLSKMAKGLAEILLQMLTTEDKLGESSLKGLREQLIQAGSVVSLKLQVDEALDRIMDLMADLRVGGGGFVPGCLHLISYQHAVWINRPHTFFVGLDSGTFPGYGRQEPILLDSERKDLKKDLHRSASRPGENLYAMTQALVCRRGKVVLSFPSHDVVENKELFPSPVVLQVYRLLKGNSSLDYSHLKRFLGTPAGFFPQDEKPPLDDLEWWLKNFFSKPGLVDGTQAIRLCYPGIGRGQKAMESRQGPVLSEYEGKIEVNAKELDPREVSLVMSCRRIETLARCPYNYFLRYMLEIYPPEERLYDPVRWLDSVERGELLHKIFYRFMRKLVEQKEKVNYCLHKDVIMEIANELILEYKEKIPPPNKVIFEREVYEIQRSCEVFLLAEEKLSFKTTPLYFEVPFGLGERAVAQVGYGLPDPVEVDLGCGKKFFLCGRIDRIDRTGEGVYQVWDYKTGGTYGFDEKDFLKQGRQIQHALYAIAAEKALSCITRVDVSGYFFPTVKGGGQRFARLQHNRQKVQEALNNLFDLLAKGSFLATDEKEECRYCDYREVCGEEAALRSKELCQNDTSFLPWRRLKEIE